MEDDRARKEAEDSASRNAIAASLTDEEIKQSTSSGRRAQGKRQQNREDKMRKEEAKEAAQGEANGKVSGSG
jgi:hypothetical protein